MKDNPPITPAVRGLIIRRLGELAEMPANWDSYGAEPIHRLAILHAADMALNAFDGATPTPAVVPCPAGGIQFEWHYDPLHAEIEFLTDGGLEFHLEDHGAKVPITPDPMGYKTMAFLEYLVNRVKQMKEKKQPNGSN